MPASFAALFAPMPRQTNPAGGGFVRDPLGRDGYDDDPRPSFDEAELGGQLEAARRLWRRDASLDDLFGGSTFELASPVGPGKRNRPGDVFKVQTLLHREGYMDAGKTDGPSGFWGLYDHEAVKRFQRDHGLTVDGYLDPGGETIGRIKRFYDDEDKRMDNLRKRHPFLLSAAGNGPEPQTPKPAPGPARKAAPQDLPEDARFDGFIEQLRKFEGGYSNDRDDRGGETNHGVTKATLADYHAAFDDPAVSTDVRKLSAEEAKRVLRIFYYDRYRVNEISDAATARHLFDISVNPGPARAGRWAQQAVNAIKSEQVLEEDGVMGSRTRAAINNLSPAELARLNDLLSDKRMANYEEQMAKNRTQEKYRPGWTSRTLHFRARE